ncbi:hypothetical protein PC120_g27373, partial [Phytophthora cactorum]
DESERVEHLTSETGRVKENNALLGHLSDESERVETDNSLPGHPATDNANDVIGLTGDDQESEPDYAQQLPEKRTELGCFEEEMDHDIFLKINDRVRVTEDMWRNWYHTKAIRLYPEEDPHVKFELCESGVRSLIFATSAVFPTHDLRLTFVSRPIQFGIRRTIENHK